MDRLLRLITTVLACLSPYCSASSSATPVKAGYWPSYSADSYPPSSINSLLFTHLFYAFAILDNSTFQVQLPAYDDGSLIGGFTSAVKQSNPNVQTLISIQSDKPTFASMASSTSFRKSFITSSIALARNYNYDGLDVDWEYPQSSTDMDNLGTLFSEWRSEANMESAQSGLPPLILTAAVYYAATIVYDVGIQPTYPIDSIAQNLDWVNIMSYDYHGSWEPTKTGEHTALYDPNSDLSTSFGVASWLNAGLSSKQAVLGLAVYGRSWILKNPSSDTGVGAAAVGGGIDGGTPVYYQIVDLINSSNATVVFDDTTASVYTYSGTIWIGYDNPRSISSKVAFLNSKGLLGYFFWTVSFDYQWSLATTASQALAST
ncbi:hypothetical protein O6H91_Y330700 [Diphasiastrum complanatum]|nr:hypothetical protein O6H91_Y330700 [Diphasiastrum complanatum]